MSHKAYTSGVFTDFAKGIQPSRGLKIALNYPKEVIVCERIPPNC